MESVSHRRATRADLEGLRALADESIGELQRGFLTPTQIEASRAIMWARNRRILQPRSRKEPRS